MKSHEILSLSSNLDATRLGKRASPNELRREHQRQTEIRVSSFEQSPTASDEAEENQRSPASECRLSQWVPFSPKREESEFALPKGERLLNLYVHTDRCPRNSGVLSDLAISLGEAVSRFESYCWAIAEE